MLLIIFVFFFFNDTATTEIYTLSLHDALPILPTSALLTGCSGVFGGTCRPRRLPCPLVAHEQAGPTDVLAAPVPHRDRKSTRLNSSHAHISYAVFCFKKKKTILVLDSTIYLLL